MSTKLTEQQLLSNLRFHVAHRGWRLETARVATFDPDYPRLPDSPHSMTTDDVVSVQRKRDENFRL